MELARQEAMMLSNVQMQLRVGVMVLADSPLLIANPHPLTPNPHSAAASNVFSKCCTGK